MDHSEHSKSGKVLLQIIGVIIIFVVGLALGFFFGRRHRFSPRLMAAGMNRSSGLQTITIKTASGTTTIDRDAGVIGTIENNQITITDNAGQKQTIVPESSTIIMGSKGQTDLSGLKVGQRISVDGTLNSSNQLEARTIIVL